MHANADAVGANESEIYSVVAKNVLKNYDAVVTKELGEYNM